MPGAYTHITMASIASERQRMTQYGIPSEAIAACGKWLKYCELGVVSPDIAYLDLLHPSAKRWADLMHYQSTDGVIRHAIAALRGMTSVEREKGLAWLLGYTAHVVMDCTIHPVINMKVGPYISNQRMHRVCEINQDAYIFQRLNLPVTAAEYLDTGIAACVGSKGSLDPTIDSLWTKALRSTYTAALNPPIPSTWHSAFTSVIDGVVEEMDWLFAIARHVAPDCGLAYPDPANIERTFIDDLRTPLGKPIKFDDLFDQAMVHVCTMWRVVARGALGIDDEFQNILQHCDLDTGKSASGVFIFWQGARS